MIRVEVEKGRTTLKLYDDRKKLKCPHCGCEHYFYYYSPQKCEECHKILPDTIFMMDDVNGRLEYYKTGMARIFMPGRD